eukprot:TRINITY_DN45265_c0_g1_i1.p1 TRINITY_DN45265_c0_g1~~TRINITY_DN45265_c0_g1_i1.p1  ORF type:complete len:123 (+),score=16.51 TRINITY_DN45265_c0_g1_i1:43-411(+)
MLPRPPRSTLSSSSAASDVYKRQTRNHPLAAWLWQQPGARWPPLQAAPGPENVSMENHLNRRLESQIAWQLIEYKPLRLRCAAGLLQSALVGQLLSLIHISEPTRLLSISYAVFCLKKKKEE